MNQEMYGELCTEFYDLTKPVGGEYPDIPFLAERLLQNRVQGLILEAGVGTGRALIPLLEMGYRVDGIDNSEDMINVCRLKCEERNLYPNLYMQDLRELKIDRSYEAIFMTAGSFMLIEDLNDASSVLSFFYKLLVPGGTLIIDIENLSKEILLDGKITDVFDLKLKNGDQIQLSRNTNFNDEDQVLVHQLTYIKLRNGTVIKSEQQRFPLRSYKLTEISELLMNAGFRSLSVFVDYSSTATLSVEPYSVLSLECHKPIINSSIIELTKIIW